MIGERATASCRNCAERVVEDGVSPTGWRHIESRLVNCEPPTGGRRNRPRRDEPMAVPATPSDFLERWRRDQRDDERTPSDVRAAIFFASLGRADVTRAEEDRLLRLSAAEIALIRPIRRSTAA